MLKKSRQSILNILTSRQDLFNGIGTSYKNKILHLSWEHPAQKTHMILEDEVRKARLKSAIYAFFSFAKFR